MFDVNSSPPQAFCRSRRMSLLHMLSLVPKLSTLELANTTYLDLDNTANPLASFLFFYLFADFFSSLSLLFPKLNHFSCAITNYCLLEIVFENIHNILDHVFLTRDRHPFSSKSKITRFIPHRGRFPLDIEKHLYPFW